jgi:hypothetical protein
VAKEKVIFQKAQQAAQAKMYPAQGWVQPYGQQQPRQQWGGQEQIDQEWGDQWNLPMGMAGDTRTKDLQQWVPAVVSQDIIPENMWPEMGAVLRDASSY